MKRLLQATTLLALGATLSACPPPAAPPDAAPDVSMLDAAPDAVPDVAALDATPDASPDATPDVAAFDIAPDATPDASPDAAPDSSAPDATPDVSPDAAPDASAPDAPAPDAPAPDAPAPDAPAPAAWSVAVENPTGTSTTQLRAVAVAHMGAPSVYVGFIQTSNAPAGRTVRRYAAAAPHALLGELGPGTGQPKALDVDDRGNVFIAYRYSGASGSELVSASADLRAVAQRLDVGSPVVGGLCVRREGAAYRAYVTYEGDGVVRRYDVTDPARMAPDEAFGEGGALRLPSGGELRGCAFDPDGNLWVASRAAGAVYRVAADLGVSGTAAVPGAFDVAFRGGRAYVTAYRGADSAVRVLDARTMAPLDELTPARIGFPRGAREGYAGVDVDGDGRLWLADEDHDGASPVRDRLLASPPLP